MPAVEKYLTLTHGKTRYFEAGAGAPTILIHGVGFTAGADSWLPVMEPLSRRLRCLAIDCLNWGPGDVFNEEFSFAYLVDHVREVMDALGLERAHIVGHSMGGWIATLFAYESPNRVMKLVLSGAGGAATRPLQSMVEWKPPTAEQVRAQVTPRLERAGIDPEPIVEQYVQKAADPVHCEAYAKVMRHMSHPLTRQRYNTLRRLPYITAPTLVIWGRDDQTNALELGEAIYRGIKGARLVVLDHCGHFTYQDQPERFVEEVAGFLAD